MLALLVAASSSALGLKTAAADTHTQGPPLRCQWVVQGPLAAAGPVRLRVTLTNRSARPLNVLEWGTPFEGWLSPWLEVRLEGRALPYQGASVKRGDPDASEYLRLAPGRSRQATVDLAEVFDLTRPGRYELSSALILHDVTTGAPPRPRARHEPTTLACPPLSFQRPG